MREPTIGKETRSCRSASKRSRKRQAMEAASVDRGCWPDLRRNRRRRVLRGPAAGRPQRHAHASGQRRDRRRQDRRSRRFANMAIGRGRGAITAQLIDRLTAAGAKRIFFDINFAYQSDPVDDERLRRGARARRVRNPGARYKVGPVQGTQARSAAAARFTRHAKLATLSVQYNYQNAVWRLPYALHHQWRSLSRPWRRRWRT